MAVGILDVVEPTPSDTLPPHPSPAVLRAAGGDELVELASVGAAVESEVDRILVQAPPWCAARAKELCAPLGDRVELVDPWSLGKVGPGGYEALRSNCHADVDLPPRGRPVHPWAAASVGASSPASLSAAVAALSGLRETALILADERVPLRGERLSSLADLVTTSLRERNSLVQLHLRAWPADLLVEHTERHLPTLPIASLDVLAGSLRDESLKAQGAGLDAARTEEAIAKVARAGLGHLTTLSIVLGLPGETIDDSVAVLNRALQLCSEHRLVGVRCALWLGEPTPPVDAADQRDRFMAAHPDWEPVEYQGLHDLAAVLRAAVEGIELVGPSFLPDWD